MERKQPVFAMHDAGDITEWDCGVILCSIPRLYNSMRRSDKKRAREMAQGYCEVKEVGGPVNADDLMKMTNRGLPKAVCGKLLLRYRALYDSMDTYKQKLAEEWESQWRR